MASTNDPINISVRASCYLFPGSYFDINNNTVPYTINAVFNVPLAIIATTANALVLLAIWKTPSLHLPSKMLLCNLVLTDLGTGLVAMPSFALFLISKVNDGLSDIRCVSALCFVTLGSIVSCISLTTITAISLDRCAALHFRLKYREIVTAKRVGFLLVASWLYAMFYALTWLWSTIWYSQLALVTYCTSFLVTSLAYVKINRGLRGHRKRQVHADQEVSHSRQESGGGFNVVQYRRSAFNMLWIYGLFILCYLPYLCAMAVRRFVGATVLVQCVLEFAVTVVFLNSCLNPLLYCFRLPEIRYSVLQTLRNVCSKTPNPS